MPISNQEANRRKSLMRTAGLPTTNDNSWGSWHEQNWQRYLGQNLRTLPTNNATITVQRASRPISFGGFLLDTWDKLTGQDKIQVAHSNGEIRQGPTTNNASALPLKADPRMLSVAIPAAVGSTIIMGRGPEVMQDINSMGQSIKNWVQGIPSTVRGWFRMNNEAEEDNSEDNSEPTSEDTAQPSSQNNRQDNNKPDSKIPKWLWETKSNSPNSSRFGRVARNYFLRVPIGTGVAAPTVDVAGNLGSMGLEDENTKHEWIWPATKTRFAITRGIGKAYATQKPNTVKQNSQTQKTDTINTNTPIDTTTIVTNSGISFDNTKW